ncbi:MAG: efflux RND transporter permease subunit [Desulfosalsimonadaceae bacterium]
MKTASFSVKRPIFTTMVTLCVIIIGGMALSRLPVDLLPDITYPTLSISTTYEQASPEIIEELITRPIEEAMSAVPGVEEVSSVSTEGQSSVRVTFAWGTDLDTAANDVRDRLDRVVPRLPEDADTPSLRKFDPASFPILVLGASSRLDPIEARRIIDDDIKYRIERVPGVAAMDVWGGLNREIHVDLDPDRLKALGLSTADIITAIRRANITLPAGSIESDTWELTLRTAGEFSRLEEIRETTVAVRGGVPVHLEQVASVSDSYEKIRRIVRVNGESGLRLSVNKQSGTNTVEVARRVLGEIERINRDIPQVRISPIIDTSEYIQRSITNVGSAALYGSIFAILILMVFLRNIRSTAIISVAIPVSIIGTFAMIYMGGFTLNLMTLGGLALGVGMLVDNAIVVLENIYRMREQGIDADTSAINGTAEVSSAIIASTVTTLTIFFPLIFVRGMAGIMFYQLALVVAFALLCSLAVALTLIPMLASRFLSPPEKYGKSRFRTIEHLFDIFSGLNRALENAYHRILSLSLDHPFTTLFITVLILLSSLMMIPKIGTELMPQTDESEVRVNAEMAVGIRLDITDRVIRNIEEIVFAEIPEMKNVVASVGGSHWRGGGANEGQLRIALVPRSERDRSSAQIAAALRPKLADIPGAVIRTREGQGLFLIRRATGGTERIEVEIRGYDLDTADALAERISGIIEKVDGVTDTIVSRTTGAPERLISVDRLKAESMGISVRDVSEILQTVIAGSRAGNFREGGKEYPIRVLVKDAEYFSVRDILDTVIVNAAGVPVAIRNIVTVESKTGPIQIERKNQERIVSIRANIAGRDMGSILSDIRGEIDAVAVPSGFAINYGGDYEEQQDAFRELLVGLILALVLVYMVLASLYESLRDPFVVMFSVPLAVIGTIWMLYATGTTFNLQSYIGCIMLGGIVVNNAILLVDYTNLLRREENMGLRNAIEEAGRRRLRPILMTALTTVFALIPLAIGFGEGGEAQAPMARAVIGGLISSTLITLVFVPVIYSFITKKNVSVTNPTPETKE